MKPLRAGKARLNPSVFQQRQQVNFQYMYSLDERRLMANYYLEAGLTSNQHQEYCGIHYGGWESPDQQVRGTFSGHFLSAAAMAYDTQGDQLLKYKADWMVQELSRCAKEHLDGWCMAIPQQYLHWIMQDKWVWAPQYNIHKTLMGLIDAYRFGKNPLALKTAEDACDWIEQWVKDFDADACQQMLKWETGGMMEVFADLYDLTKKERYRDLMEKYCRFELFERLLRGEDALSFAHCNTTLPEAHGCARAYEVTGEHRYREMVEAFWRNGVEERNAFATGGQNSYELWLPDFSGRQAENNQEFCTVYNLIRLADYLYRWTGEVKYADYIERALYNGVLAQQHKETGANCYFLPLHAGAQKKWGDRYDEMYCCYGTTIQAQSSYGYRIFYESDDAVFLAQYIPADVQLEQGRFSLERRYGGHDLSQFDWQVYQLTAQIEQEPVTLNLRRPWWAEEMVIELNGEKVDALYWDGYVQLQIPRGKSVLTLRLLQKLRVEKISPDDTEGAVLFGPMVLAGIVPEQRMLYADAKRPERLLSPMGSMDSMSVPRRWMTRGQPVNFQWMPLYEVTNETYTVYFPFADGEKAGT